MGKHWNRDSTIQRRRNDTLPSDRSEGRNEIEGYVAEIVRNSKEDILDIRVEMGEFYLEELVRRVADTYVEKCAVRMVELVIGKYENRIVRGDLDRALEVIDNVMENAF